MCDIEQNYHQETSHPDPSPTAHHQFSASAAAAAQPQCQEPAPTRPSLHSTSSPSDTDYQLRGFTKLPLPHSFPSPSPPPLRRTLSEPIYSPRTVNYSAPPLHFVEFPNSPISIGSRGNFAQESVQFPNATTSSPLQRTVSDQNPIVHVAGPSSTPTRPPAGRKSLRSSPTCGESPTTKRLKRMKERMKEMSQWWNEIVSEDEDETEPENDSTDNNPKEDCEKHKENPAQEDVWIEKNGDNLVLHFKCPCSKGYEVLLSGRNCYYKLTGF